MALWQQFRARFANFEASRWELPYENRSRIIRIVSASIVPDVMTCSRATSVSALGYEPINRPAGNRPVLSGAMRGARRAPPSQQSFPRSRLGGLSRPPDVVFS